MTTNKRTGDNHTRRAGHTDDIPRCAATARRGCRARRWMARLSSARRRHGEHGTRRPSMPHTAPATRRDASVPGSVRDHVLRDYHAANLAHARTVAEQMVRAGFNVGTVPYGYRAQRVRVASTGQRSRWRTRLVLEPVEAATVKMIFTWRGVDGLTIAEICQRLAAARYPAPLAPDSGQPGEWDASNVRAVLRNPKYLGRQVWGRRHHGRPVPADRWVWSPVWAHPPIVSAAEFSAVNQRSRLAAALPTADRSVAGATDRRAV